MADTTQNPVRFIAGGLRTAVAVAVAAIAVYSSVQGQWESVLGVAFVYSAAAMVVGALLGFLFGVPRVAGGLPEDGKARSVSRYVYSANTNLEQVSDWLTKILVGVGLTQIGNISATAQRLFAAQGPSLGGGSAGASFAGALDIYFLGLGFVIGWLLTRLYLSGAMRWADALGAMTEALDREQKGDTLGARRLRQQAADLIDELGPLGKSYDSARRTAFPSDERTRQMQRIFDQARGAAQQSQPSAEEVRKLFRRGQDGDRLGALAAMAAVHAALDMDCVVDAIANPRSAFEQYQALVVGRDVLASLTPPERERLVAAVSSVLGELGSGDRAAIAREIVNSVGGPSG
jgi:hypothetical protein